MRRFINLYIVLFLIDAGLSLADDLSAVSAAHLPVFSAVRNLVAVLVVVLSLVVYLLLGIDRRLPKRVFIPLTLYVFWCMFGAWPLLGVIPRDTFGVMVSFGQVFIAGVAVITLRSFYGGTLLPEEHFRQPLFGWRNTLVFGGVNLLLLPVLLVYCLLAAAGCYLDQKTAGFMRLSPTGLFTSERSYQRGDQVVRLAAMMHIARQGFYQELVASLPSAKTIILAEGVTDRNRLLTSRFNYGNLAGLVGLSSQEKMHLDGHRIGLDDLDASTEPTHEAGKPDIVRADLDLNRFHPQTVEFLNVLGRTLLGGKPLAQGMKDYNDWAQANESPELFSAVTSDIFDARNQVVIGALRRSLKRYDTIVIPWGAMHMPAIEAAVLDEGFVPEAKKERLLFSFGQIPFARLWRQLAAPAEQSGASGTATSE